MIYKKSHSWHIQYAMEPWLIYVNEGFDGGSNTKSHLWVLNYRHEGKYHDVGGGQGGRVNAPWDGRNRTLCLVCRGWENHLSLLCVVALFDSLLFFTTWKTGSPYALEVMFSTWVYNVINLLFSGGGLEYL